MNTNVFKSPASCNGLFKKPRCCVAGSNCEYGPHFMDVRRDSWCIEFIDCKNYGYITKWL